MTATEYSSAEGALVAESAATQRVDALFDLERWADVVSHAAPLMVQAPDPKVFAQVAHAHWALQDWPAMRQVLALARQHWPGDERFCFYGALLAMGQNLFTQAEREVRGGLALAPQHAGLHFALAQVLWHLGDLPGARGAIEQALALEPSKALYQHLMAALMADVDITQARHHNRLALALEPDNADYLALQASLESGESRQLAARLLRSSLRVDPSSRTRQRRLHELTVLWWVDVSCVAGSVLLSGLATWWEERPDWLFGLAWLVLCVLGVSLMGRQSRQPMLMALCGLQALVGMSNTPQGLPQRLIRGGWDGVWAHVWSWDTLAYVGGTVVVAGLLWVFISLLRVAFWNALVHVWEFAQEVRQAMVDAGPLLYSLELLQRPGVRYNLMGATLVAGTVCPPISLATGLLLQVFVLPLALWGLGQWLLPKGTAPQPSVLFMLLCFGLAMTTFLFVGVSQFSLDQPDHALQAAWAMAVWLYALLVLNNLRQL